MVEIKKEEVLIKPGDIKPSDKRFEVVGTFNPGAIRLKDGNIMLYVRVLERLKEWESTHYYYSPRYSSNKKFQITVDKIPKKEISHVNKGNSFYFPDETLRLTYISHLRKVILDESGFNVKKIANKPSFYGTKDDSEFGVEDPRIIRINNKYIMTYVSLSRYRNVSTNLAISKDGTNWERKGVIFRQQNKDVVIFPEKIGNKFIALNRPEGNFDFSPPHIWISYSPDLEHWGHGNVLLMPKKDSWDSGKIGAGPPPIKTDKGWLIIYHGILKECDQNREKCHYNYCVGVMLVDKKNPYKILAKSPSDKPFLCPTQLYEKKGFIKNVIFPTGIVRDKEDILLFSGAADTVTTVKKISIEEIMKSMKPIKN